LANTGCQRGNALEGIRARPGVPSTGASLSSATANIALMSSSAVVPPGTHGGREASHRDPRASTQRGHAARALVLCADVGESHLQMARMLADELGRRKDVQSVSVLGDFSSLGPALDWMLSRGFRFHLGEVKWSYDLAYALFTRVAPMRLAGERALYALGATALADTIRRYQPDVVISTYPVMNPILARLRASGRMDCPAAAVIGPLGGHEFWVQPRLDLHMAVYREAIPAVERLANGARVAAVRPLVRPEFFEPGSRERTRAELGLPPHASLIVISGGGWGAGDLGGALQTCLRLANTRLIAVCGRNQQLRVRLAARYAGDARVKVLGFTRRMRDLLWAADAFVTATAGTSCVEARMCGCPTIVYGFAVGHVRDNARALVHHQLVRSADSTRSLLHSVAAALRQGRTPIPRLDSLPSAAELTVALARSHRAKQPASAQARTR
jgi:UDP-N-acetylglucosamine:LPS N-acetylglucosamine transferase